VLWAIRWSTREHEGRAALAPRLCAAREQIRKCLQRKASHREPLQRNATRVVATQRNATQREPFNATRAVATQRNASRCNATQREPLQRNATQRNASCCNATQRIATQRNITQRIATRAAPFAIALRSAHAQTTVQQSTAQWTIVRRRSHARHYGTRAHYSACKSCRRSTSVKSRLIASTIISPPQPCSLQRVRNGYNRQLQGMRTSLSVSKRV
jgi:hypothetical protein